jgi:RNA polymerase-interacting CarD/CdnL/TRCF family regulator
MSTLKNWTLTLLKLFHTVKNENLQWQENNQVQQNKLKHSRILATKALEAELKKKSLQLEHEISVIRNSPKEHWG